MNTYRYGLRFLLAAFSATLLTACAKTSDAPEAAKAAPPAAKLESSFYPQGQAGLDRLQQNTMQRICSEYEGKPVPDELAKQIIAEATAAVRFPRGRQVLWRLEERRKDRQDRHRTAEQRRSGRA